jgi:hypothetical protein
VPMPDMAYPAYGWLIVRSKCTPKRCQSQTLTGLGMDCTLAWNL